MRLPCPEHDAYWASWMKDNPDKDHDRCAELARSMCPACADESTQRQGPARTEGKER